MRQYVYADEEDGELVFLIIDQYGIGNYEEARSDLDEFSVVFN